jgi:very-short-patch-repair endonuclease
MTFRWNEEAVAAFERRAKGWKKTEGNVTTHCIERPGTSSKTVRRSELEEQLKLQLLASGIKGFIHQHQPLLPRKWSLDFAMLDKKLAVEVQGMVHRIKDKFQRDIEKRAELMLNGWRVLEVDGEAIKDGRALGWIKRLLA